MLDSNQCQPVSTLLAFLLNLMGLIQFITSLGKKSDPSNKQHPNQDDGYKPVLASQHSGDKLTTTTTNTSNQQPEHEGFGSSFSMRFNEDNGPRSTLATSPPRFGNTHIPPPTADEGGGSVTPHWEPYYLFGKSSNPANEHYIKIDE